MLSIVVKSNTKQRRIYNGTNGASVPGIPLKMRIRPLPFLNSRGLPFLLRELIGKNVCINKMSSFEELITEQE